VVEQVKQMGSEWDEATSLTSVGSGSSSSSSRSSSSLVSVDVN